MSAPKSISTLLPSGVEGVFRTIARLTHGAYCRFDPGAARQLAELVRSRYAGGTAGLLPGVTPARSNCLSRSNTSVTSHAIKKRPQRARSRNGWVTSPADCWLSHLMCWRRLLVAGRALVRRARLQKDFTHSRNRGAPHVSIIERLAAQPLGHRLQIHGP